MRENKRMINRSIRELDRERASLERQQEKLVKDIKKAAKEGQMVRTFCVPLRAVLVTLSAHQGSVRIMAKDLVRTRQYVTKFYQMRSQLQAVSLKLEVFLTCLFLLVLSLSH